MNLIRHRRLLRPRVMSPAVDDRAVECSVLGLGDRTHRIRMPYLTVARPFINRSYVFWMKMRRSSDLRHIAGVQNSRDVTEVTGPFSRRVWVSPADAANDDGAVAIHGSAEFARLDTSNVT